MNHNKKNNEQQQQFEFCEVCKLNHNQGRRHIYFPNHKNSLRALLTRFQSKRSDVKFFLKTPIPLRHEHAISNRLWCIFCNCDVLDLDSPFACRNAIEHLASKEHWKRVKGFMGKYGGGMDRVDSFRVCEADFDKWKKKCNSLKIEAANSEGVAPVNNIHNELKADHVNSFHKNNVNSLNFNITNGFAPLHRYMNERAQMSSSELPSASEIGSSLRNPLGDAQVGVVQCLKVSTGCMDNQHSFTSIDRGWPPYGYHCNGSVLPGVRTADEENRSQGLLILTQISHASQEGTEGNVHTGAPPPWLVATQGNQLGATLKPELSNLTSSKVGKSSKLNPKRVGAAWAERRKLELELEKRGELLTNNFDANWLPNFGRVWQSGTRKESRKEFQMENNKVSHKDDDQSERCMPLQPYMSKRMVKFAFDELFLTYLYFWYTLDVASFWMFLCVSSTSIPLYYVMKISSFFFTTQHTITAFCICLVGKKTGVVELNINLTFKSCLELGPQNSS